MRYSTALAVWLISAVTLSFPAAASASERCLRTFLPEISKADRELAASLERQVRIDKEVRKHIARRRSLTSQIGAIAGGDPTMAYTAAQLRLIRLYKEVEAEKRQRLVLEREAYSINARIIELRKSVPKALQIRMRECAAAEKAVNRLVNFAVQGFVLAATGSLGIPAPRKSSYVDIREMLPRKR